MRQVYRSIAKKHRGRERCTIAFIRFLIISFILLLQGSIASAQLLDVPLGDELYHEVYDFVDRIVAKNYITNINKNTRPYSQGEVAKILRELDKKVKEGGLKLSQVEEQRLIKLLLELSPTIAQDEYLFQTQGEKHKFGFDFGVGESTISRKQDESKLALERSEGTGYAILFRPTAIGQIRDDFAFKSDLKVYYLSATQFPDIPKTEVRMSQPAKETKTASLSNYYIKAKLPWFSILFGHDNLHWGPGRHGALLISEHPLPMNMFKLQAQYYPVNFQAVTARLGSSIDKKYLSGHRLELNIRDKLRLGVAETVVYGHRFEMIYLNPVQIYTTTEFVFPEAVGENDNVLISGDLDFVPLRNLELYSEVMIDDYRPFSYSPKNWGNKFGLLFGGYWVDPFSFDDTDLRLEYAFVNQYAYTHATKINAYTHFNSPIGHQIGTDADDIWLNLKHWFTPNFTTSLSYELERHGEGNVNKPHPSGAPDDDEWEFLYGVTESTHSICLGASYNLIGKYSVTLEYTHSWIKNVSNQNGVNENNNQVLLSGQYRF
jgi:hypothetical protein